MKVNAVPVPNQLKKPTWEAGSLNISYFPGQFRQEDDGIYNMCWKINAKN